MCLLIYYTETKLHKAHYLCIKCLWCCHPCWSPKDWIIIFKKHWIISIKHRISIKWQINTKQSSWKHNLQQSSDRDITRPIAKYTYMTCVLYLYKSTSVVYCSIAGLATCRLNGIILITIFLGGFDLLDFRNMNYHPVK